MTLLTAIDPNFNLAGTVWDGVFWWFFRTGLAVLAIYVFGGLGFALTDKTDKARYVVGGLILGIGGAIALEVWGIWNIVNDVIKLGQNLWGWA